MMKNAKALDLGGQLDGRTLFVMSQVAGLWAELLFVYETADADDLKELIRRHNLGVFHQPRTGLHVDFSAGSADEPSNSDQVHGLVFYLVPPVHDLFMGTATMASIRAWAKSHGLEPLLKELAGLDRDAVELARDALLADLAAVRLIRYEISNSLRKSQEVRDLVTVRMATDAMAWTFEWEARRAREH